jgi:hypothetical protein
MQAHYVEAKNRLSMRRLLRFGCIWMGVLGGIIALVSLLTPMVSMVNGSEIKKEWAAR